MAGLIVAHPLENLLRSALSVTVTTGTPLTDYPATKLYDGVWHGGLRVEGTDLDVEIELASAQSIAFAALLNSNVTVAASLQAHTSASWGTPDVDLAFAVPTLTPDGFFSSPYLTPASAAKAFIRLHITGNDEPISIGELFIASTLRSLDLTFVHPGVTGALVGGRTAYETPAGVMLAYERRTPVKEISGVIRTNHTTERAVIEDLLAASRYGARPIPCVPRTDENDAWMAWLLSDRVPQNAVGIGPHLYDHQIGLSMCARGLPWVDPDEL